MKRKSQMFINSTLKDFQVAVRLSLTLVRYLLVFAVLPVIFGVPPADAGEQREECVVCGMWIDLYRSTRHVIHFKDNTTRTFCSIACAAKYLKDHDGEAKNIMAADFITQEIIDARDAYYLEGSDVPGVMSYTSRIAFKTRDEAERFREKHGGMIITFKQANENQLKGESIRKVQDEKKPVKPLPKDKCPVCGMFVAKYPDWTAEVIFRDGSYAVFDGAADMFEYYFDTGKYGPLKTTADIEAVYVTDYYSLELTDGFSAYYVIGSDVLGPMGRELVPFEKEPDAREFLQDHGGQKVVTFREITREIISDLR